MDDLAAMARLVEALEPWSAHTVIVGGWAHRLHRLHPDASLPAYQPIVTLDADIAFGSDLQLVGSIGEALRAAGFQENLTSEHVPPISHYSLAEELGGDGLYAEFLTPLRGSGIRRDGTDDATLAAAGVTAQKLRNLDVLLVAPWTLRLTPGELLPVKQRTTIRIANPVSFMVQKLLIHSERRDAKKAQDILYLNDTFELFGGRLMQLRTQWHNDVRPSLTPQQQTKIRESVSAIFSAVTDTIRAASSIAPERRLSPAELQQRCLIGLSEIIAE